MEEKILNFYRQALFGRRFNFNMQKPNNKNVNDIKFTCFITAWNDMSRHQKNIIEKYKNIANELNFNLRFVNKANKEELINRDDFIRLFFNSSIQILDKLNSLEAIRFIDKYIAKGYFEIGKIQKIVNMYYKYLYTFCFSATQQNIYPHFLLKETNFANCDCPIDNYILDAMLNKSILDKKQRNLITWSLMDEKTYLDLQNKISTFIKANPSKYKIALDFDFENFGVEI